MPPFYAIQFEFIKLSVIIKLEIQWNVKNDIFTTNFLYCKMIAARLTNEQHIEWYKIICIKYVTHFNYMNKFLRAKNKNDVKSFTSSEHQAYCRFTVNAHNKPSSIIILGNLFFLKQYFNLSSLYSLSIVTVKIFSQ